VLIGPPAAGFRAPPLVLEYLLDLTLDVAHDKLVLSQFLCALLMSELAEAPLAAAQPTKHQSSAVADEETHQNRGCHQQGGSHSNGRRKEDAKEN